LLTEYFVFPQKFLFFDLVGLAAAHWQKFADRAGIYVYMKAENEELSRFVSVNTLRLGCAPIVNLFRQTADPLHLSHRQTEYRVVPDARRESVLEIYSVDRVVASSPRGEEFEYAPFYSFRHGGSGDQRTFWHCVRRPRLSEQGGSDVEGTDVFLTLVDLDFLPTAPADLTLHLETTCINRGTPTHLVSREGRIRFRFPEGAGPVSDVICLGAPTQTCYPEIRRMLLWRLISHLSLNHVSLHVEDTDASALAEILRLYDPIASRDTRDMIDGILNVSWSRGVARVGGAAGGFCRGLDAEVVLDEEKFTGSSPYLFATVLSHFFGLYVSVNSFSRVKARIERSRGEGASWTWPPQAGERQLL
jgi:type VI secretion system protein ImpG